MGSSRYSTSDYTAYSTTHSLQSARRDEIFKSRHLSAVLDPANVFKSVMGVRESVDSAVNPNSTPVIFGLDVTGSMGFVAESIAKTQLDKVFTALYKYQPISDPHIMFTGIGDLDAYDEAPLQVSQFEAGAVPLIEQLRAIYLEGGGGGNSYESYDLPWYFAANFTKIDSFDKRSKKGYIFTIGDEMPPPEAGLDYGKLKSKIFKNSNIPDPGSRSDLLEKVKERYKVFHIVAEEGNFCRINLRKSRAAWTELLGPNAIFMKDHSKLDIIVTAILQVAEGADMDEVINSSNDAETLQYAFHNALNSQQ